MKKWRGWDVLKERFNERLERLGCFLKESSMNRWKGLDVLGGKFDEKMERLGCT